MTNSKVITITDNAGRVKVEQVLYTVTDIFGEEVIITVEGLQYAEDSLRRKRQARLIAQFSQIPQMLSGPDIVIRDSSSPKDTVIYYKRFYDDQRKRYHLMAVIVKIQGMLKFLYNIHLQQSGKVKGYRERPKPKILYISPQRKPRNYGL